MTTASAPEDVLPFFLCDSVIKGFGRGSKELGIPTGTFFTRFFLFAKKFSHLHLAILSSLKSTILFRF